MPSPTNGDTFQGGGEVPSGGGGGGDLFGAIISTGGAIYNAEEQRKADRKNIQRNYQNALGMLSQEQMFNLENWNRMNAYNHPSAVMERLKAAGLNPNLVYGNGAQTQSGNIASASQSAPEGEITARQMPIGPILDSINQYQDTRVKQAQVDNIEAMTKATNVNANLTALKSAAQGSKNIQEEAKANIAHELSGYQAMKGQYQAWDSKWKMNQNFQKQTTIQLDNEMRRLKIKAERTGITPRDRMKIRTLIQSLEAIGVNTVKIRKRVNNIIN